MTTVYLLLGGNLGNVAQTFSAVRSIIDAQHPVVTASSLYRSEPWGFSSSRSFLNQVLVIKTGSDPHELLNFTQSIEDEMGRERSGSDSEYTSRTLDIDILFYGNKVIDSERLTVPHPRLHLRKFTLEPLLETAPDFVCPDSGFTVSELYKKCTDQSGVCPI